MSLTPQGVAYEKIPLNIPSLGAILVNASSFDTVFHLNIVIGAVQHLLRSSFLNKFPKLNHHGSMARPWKDGLYRIGSPRFSHVLLSEEFGAPLLFYLLIPDLLQCATTRLEARSQNLYTRPAFGNGGELHGTLPDRWNR